MRMSDNPRVHCHTVAEHWRHLLETTPKISPSGPGNQPEIDAQRAQFSAALQAVEGEFGAIPVSPLDARFGWTPSESLDQRPVSFEERRVDTRDRMGFVTKSRFGWFLQRWTGETAEIRDTGVLPADAGITPEDRGDSPSTVPDPNAT